MCHSFGVLVIMMESLQGSFLVATNQMTDPRFMLGVVLICAHNESDGAMGLIVNQPLLDLSMANVFENFNMSPPTGPLPPVFFGGPVGLESAFVLHSADYSKGRSQRVVEQLFLSRDPQLLIDVSAGNGPQQYLFALGYAGWAPGQLEGELCGEGWLVLPAQAPDIFNTPPDLLRQTVTSRHGIDINLFFDIPGTA